MDVLVLILALGLAAYFAIRLYLLKKALKETSNQLQAIQKDLKQNQVLHLPLPDYDLENLMSSINCSLDAIRNERKDYAKRESEFQSEIEAITNTVSKGVDHTTDTISRCVVFLFTLCYLDLSHLLWHSVSLQGGVIWETYLKSSGMGI